MKSAHGSPLCPTGAQTLSTMRSVLSRWDITSAPCRNRTYNLMIKSQIRAQSLTRTEGVYLGFQATNDAELVPPTHPKRARRFHDKSHGASPVLFFSPLDEK